MCAAPSNSPGPLPLIPHDFEWFSQILDSTKGSPSLYLLSYPLFLFVVTILSYFIKLLCLVTLFKDTFLAYTWRVTLCKLHVYATICLHVRFVSYIRLSYLF